LVDFSIAILPDPEGSFSPGEPGIAATAGRRNRGEHAATLRVDFLNAIFGDLKQVPAIESCSRMRGDVNRAQRFASANARARANNTGRVASETTARA
jgi:hypothetical protein